MKSFVVLALLVAAALAAPPQQYASDEKHAEVIESVNDNIGLGDYKKVWKTSNGILQEEQGTLEKFNNEGDEAVVVRGSYSYTAPDGQVINVNYVADQNGFRAEGPHIPK